MQVNQRLRAFLAALVIAVAPFAPLGTLSAAFAQEAAEQPAAEQPAVDPFASEVPVAPPMPAETSVEEVENPYSLESLWKTSDFVAKGTLIVLAIMSMGTWYILVIKLYEQFQLLRQASKTRETFWAAGSLKDGIDTLAKGNAFRYIAETALEANEHHEGPLVSQIDLSTWISTQVQRSMENVQNRLQDGLAFLATVGSTAPFVGLFGTVWGIYHALTAIGISGQASIDKVAGPVGEALIMTAIGLAVAVPAVLAYNWLVRRNKKAMDHVRTFSADVHAVLISAAKPAGRGA